MIPLLLVIWILFSFFASITILTEGSDSFKDGFVGTGTLGLICLVCGPFCWILFLCFCLLLLLDYLKG